MSDINEKTGLDRREFLKRASVAAVGAALAGNAAALLSGCEKAYETTYSPKQMLTYQFVKKPAETAPKFPFPYQKLDPTTCAERAYAAYFQKGG